METGLARSVHGPSAAWPSALAALAASSRSGWEADSAGSLTTTAGRRFCTPAGAPTACRWIFVISAPDNVVGIAIARPPVAAATALATSIGRPPPSATTRSPETCPSSSPASSSTRPAGTSCTAPAASTTAGSTVRPRGVVSSV